MSVEKVIAATKDASASLAQASTEVKHAVLEHLASSLISNQAEILKANEIDLARGISSGMAQGLQDRLRLTPERIASLSKSVFEIIALADPIGEVVAGKTLPNGLKISQVRVPFGVVGMIYAARPNVTIDIASLCIKSGNAALLRGGSAAEQTNRVLIKLIQNSLASADLPSECIQSVDEFG
jgi:glutamate-5-semialdehyde dehydrogenase